MGYIFSFVCCLEYQVFVQWIPIIFLEYDTSYLKLGCIVQFCSKVIAMHYRLFVMCNEVFKRTTDDIVRAFVDDKSTLETDREITSDGN